MIWFLEEGHRRRGWEERGGEDETVSCSQEGSRQANQFAINPVAKLSTAAQHRLQLRPARASSTSGRSRLQQGKDDY